MIRSFLKEHYLAFLAAIFVGFIYIAPNIFFIFSLEDAYRGIPMMQTANEDFYLARIQEILDGHPALGSVFFFEYKDQIPLSPPTGELFYAVPSLIFDISPVHILILSRFFLPFILFLLVYYLVRKLTDSANFLSAKINAIAAALFVTLGYDLIDYRTILNYLRGVSTPGDFLIWTRPVNPILGAIFLMSFLIFLWLIVQRRETKQQKFYIIGASVFLALMVTSYFFSWGIAISIIVALILIYLLKKEYKIVKNLIIVVISSFLLSLPYWYMALQAKQSFWYRDSVLRSGLFYTHYPLFNKLMLAVLFVYLLSLFLPIFIRKIRGEEFVVYFGQWHWFCLAFILGSLLVYIQQVLTGITIWPYHFVQYSIPLAIIVSMVLFYDIIRQKSQFLWKAMVSAVIFASLSFGIYIQVSTYKQSYSYYSDLQSYVQLFNWIDRQERDCVILVKEQAKAKYRLNDLIPAFTHCNIYDSTSLSSIIPSSRIYHNYLVGMLFDGATSENISRYLEEHKKESQLHLFSNWKELFDVKDFPDIPDKAGEKSENLAEDYRKFFAQDLKSALKEYRLDYILIEGNIAGKAADLIKKLNLVYSSNNISVYKF